MPHELLKKFIITIRTTVFSLIAL
uniref:Uncharacterized protein n=1 Tax=Tetranychus urticae TaxID=32264 RepID=T1L1T2_TETUR